MKLMGLLVVAVLFSSIAEAINLNQLMKQKLQEAVNKKAGPPPAAAPAPAPAPAAAPAPTPAPQVAPSPTPTNLGETIKKTWASIPQARYNCDGWSNPISKNISDSSGRMLYCYLSSLVSLDQLQKLAGLPVFASGPHKEKLDLFSRKSFGRYNKDFANWILNKVVPVLIEPSFRAANQETFNAYLKPSLLKMRAAMLYAIMDWGRLRTIASVYEKQLNSPEGVESAFNTLYPLMSESPNPLSCTPEAVGFWVRRSIDGTIEPFMVSLTAILNAYAFEDLMKMNNTLRDALFKKK
jgi:hypothetical protein